jgi:hypothetical protein
VNQHLNYFEYFSEIEVHFGHRRGSLLLLSTLDWALIETWREAGIPLEAVLRGIDSAFEKYEARKKRASMRRVNGLAWCAQAVLDAAEELREATIGAQSESTQTSPSSGFEAERIVAHLESNAVALEASSIAPTACAEIATHLRSQLTILRAQSTEQSTQSLNVEDLERTLIVLEEKLFAALNSAATVEQLVAIKAHVARELAPYRTRMSVDQLRQVETQFLHKRLLEEAHLDRLSLFYMKHE